MPRDDELHELHQRTELAQRIIDPAETRARPIEFANLAAPLRVAGPTAFGYRP